VAAIMLKKRLHYPENMNPPYNVPFIMLGAGLVGLGLMRVVL
jgi:ammonia channel protein AmtB